MSDINDGAFEMVLTTRVQGLREVESLEASTGRASRAESRWQQTMARGQDVVSQRVAALRRLQGVLGANVGQAFPGAGSNPGSTVASAAAAVGVRRSALSVLGAVEGAFGMLGMAATTLVNVFKDAADTTQRVTLAFSQTRYQTAGDDKSAATLSVLGKAGGVDLDSAAEQLRASSTGRSGNSFLYAQQMGLDLLPDMPGHQVDQGAELTKALTWLRAQKDEGERIRAMKALHLESLDTLVRADPGYYNTAMERARTTQALNNPDERRRAADRQMSKGLAEQAWQDNQQGVGREWADKFRGVTDRFGDFTAKRAIENSAGTDGGQGADWIREKTPGWTPETGKHAATPTLMQNSILGDLPMRIGHWAKHMVTPEPNTPAPGWGGLGDWMKYMVTPRPSDTGHDASAMARSISSTGGSNTNSGSDMDDANITLNRILAILGETHDLIRSGAIVGGGERARSAMPDRISSYPAPGQYSLAQAVNDKVLRLSSL